MVRVESASMQIITILGIALGLSMDAFAVSVTNGAMIADLKPRHTVRMSFFFGAFQFIMPVLGWAAGSTFSAYIAKFDHWIAFGLLSFIGGKMILESRHPAEDGSCKEDCRNLPTLVLLSLATSIDALAVGLSFAFLHVDIVAPSLMIGAVTFLVCLAGAAIGNKVGHLFENRFELVGGLVLIAIGVNILFEHFARA